MRRASILILLVASFHFSFGAVYHVSISGNNNGDGSPGNPWRTLAHAVARVPGGQGHTIRLSAGTFVENGAFTVPAGVNIEGAGVDQTIIKAASSFYFNPATPGFALDKFLMNLTSGSATNGNQTLKNFTIDGDGKRLHGGIYVKYRNNVTIENVKVNATNFCGIWIWDVKNSLLKNVTLINCSWGSASWAAGALQLANLESVELTGLHIDENVGYGVKALGSGGNRITKMKFHDSRITVTPNGKWNNGSAPNISFELWEVLLTDCEIYNNYMDNHLSLVNVPTTPTGGRSVRVYNNVFDLKARAGGHGYGIEVTINDVEIDHNWFNGGSYGVANWSPTKCSNWSIHHNTFYGLSSGWPGSVLRSQVSGLHNVIFVNNTIELAGTSTINVVSLHGGSSTNVQIKNNLIIDSNTSYSFWQNPLIFMENGASISAFQVTHNMFQKMPVGSVGGVSYATNKTGDPQINRTGARPSPFYVPKSGSPLIDAGTNVGLPYSGSAPDIGAYEVGAVSPPPNQTPTVAITAPSNNSTIPSGNINITANASDPDGSISKVEFFNGNTKLGEDNTSPYSFTWNNVQSGSYTITARVTDNQGAAATSSPINITVNSPNTSPTVALTSPAANATFNSGATINLTANASDSDGSISKVEFYSGNTKLGEDTSSPYSFNWTNVQPGTYTLTARATDNQSASTTSSSISVKVNAANALPVVNLTSPTSNATFTTGETVSLAATASDSDGSITKVEFLNGNTKLGEDNSSPYSFNWSNVQPGTYTLTARATDNQSGTTTSSSITIKVNAANVLPAVTLTSPAANATFTSGTTINLTADASDSDGSITKVEFFNGNTKLGEDTSAPYSFNWTDVQPGTYTLTAKATDNNSGTKTSAPIHIKVTPTNISPVVAIATPSANATFEQGANINITATATDQDGTVAKVEFFVNNKKVGEDFTSPYTVNWTDAIPGNHTLFARATDNDGDVSTSSIVPIAILPEKGVPLVTIFSPANNAVIAVGDVIVIEANVSADGVISNVEFFDGTKKLGEDSSTPYSFQWNNASEGNHTIVVRATDSNNKSAEDQITIIIAGKPVANAGDDIIVTLPDVAQLDGSLSTGSSSLTFLWTQISGPTKSIIDQPTTSSPTISGLSEGEYIFELTISDNGLTEKDQVKITAVEAAPAEEVVEGVIPRFFSPNSDGINDVWELPSDEAFANATVTIFNRAGQTIYHSESYQNSWDGTVNGQALQSGAYFYVIRLRNSSDIKGSVRIVR